MRPLKFSNPRSRPSMPRRRKNFRFVCKGCGWGSWTKDDHEEHMDECDLVCSCGKFAGPPIPGLSGRWIEAPGSYMKAFGHFVCTKKNCGAYWSSAHARSDMKQACKKCNTYVKPCCMWCNNAHNTRNARERSAEDPPHRADLCEACRKGSPCTSADI